MGPGRAGARRWLDGIRASDVAVAAVLFLLALATLHMSPQDADAWGAGGVALSAAIAALLPLARRRPVVVLALMTGLFLVAQATYGLIPVFAMMLLIAVFVLACGDVASRRTTAVTAGVVSVVVDASAQLTSRDTWTDSAYLVMATAALGAAAAGDAVRSRRAYVREVEDRARRAEQAREQAMQRRVVEERLSIARDVHDLVAHHLAVINVQAEVATHVIDTRPDVAKQALGQVRGAAGSALGELGSLIGVLRREGERTPVEPSPTLAQLPQLVATFRSTGLDVTQSQHGATRPLPPPVQLAAFRLIQESLTNAHKHGAGAAELRITYAPEQVVIDVDNRTGPDARRRGRARAARHARTRRRGRRDAGGRVCRVGALPPARIVAHRRAARRSDVTTRVLLADDQPAIRAGFHLLVDSAPDLTVVGEAADGHEAVAAALRTRPDVVVMDIRMPGLDGLAATRAITADAALAGTRVLILTTFELDEYVFEALRCGASGFLGKGASADEFLDAIRTVAGGESLLSPQATRALVARFLARPETDLSAASDELARLTARERETVSLVALGMSNQDIADQLVVSPLTAKTHVNRAMSKLGVRDRAQLVVIAYRSGLVRRSDLGA